MFVIYTRLSVGYVDFIFETCGLKLHRIGLDHDQQAFAECIN